MARLLLRGAPLADVQVVLFDKDGTLSRSEPQLLVLAQARIEACLDALLRLHPERSGAGPELSSLLHRAYGLQEPAAAPLAPPGLRPCGATAVGSRQHNLISTATALAQVGLGWPEALAIAESVFNATDPLHHGPLAAPTGTTAVGPMLERLAAAVVRESPDVYFEIQCRNPHSFVALERLRAAVDRVMHAVAAGDAAGFAALMRDGESRTGAEPAPGA